MLPAAAASVKNRVGRVQKAGRYAFRPAAARVNSMMLKKSGRGLVLKTVQNKATAPR